MMMTNDDSEELNGTQPDDVCQYWRQQIQQEQKAHKDFRELADTAQEAYEKDCAFNIVWPTTEITTASLYSSTPDPEVRRRQRDGDANQKAAAQVIERGIDFSLDNHDFDGNTSRAITDMVVAGLGQARVIYKPTIGMVPGIDGVPVQAITGQALEVEQYSWKHFGWQPCKSWEKCEWVYFQHSMTRKKVKDKWEVEANPDDDDSMDGDRRVKVFEIYHKPAKAIIVICESFDTPLEVRKDELGLQGFFPCPEPMFCNIQSDKLIPASDFKYYSVQATALNDISSRIRLLVKGTKAAKYFDSHFKEMQKLRTVKDGQYVPVDDLIDKLDGASLDNVIAEVPIGLNASIIEMLTQNKEYLKGEVFEILGISDIMRGESNAQEGVETQQLKSEFGAVRIREKQATVNRFCRDLFRIMGEVIAEHFEPTILTTITGVEVTPEVEAILRDDMMRNVSIDIETDSTNAGDKLRRQKEATETLQTVIDGLGAVMGNPSIPQPVAQEIVLMLVRSVEGNTGNLEDILARMGDQNSPEAALMQMQQQLQQLQQQNQMMQQELEKRSQVDMAKDQTQAEWNAARAEKTRAEIPNVLAETEQTTVETDGKRVEQAANLTVGMTGRDPYIRGVE